MAILWCGGESIDFPNGVRPIEATSSADYRTGYARCALFNGGGFGLSNPFPGGEITSGWLSFRVKAGSFGNSWLAGLIKYTDSYGLWIYSNGSSIKLYLRTSGGDTLLGTSSIGLSTAAIAKIDMHLANYGESAAVDVYVNSALGLAYPGDVSISGIAGFDGVGAYGNTIYGRLSEIIVANTDTRNMSLRTNYLNAAGDTNDFTGAYTDIDEVAIDDADLIYDNTDGHQAMFGLADTPSGSFSVLAVKAAVRACRASDSTPTSLDIGIKSGGSVDVNDNHSLTTTWATYERLMTANPVTGNAFTPAEVDALQLVLESEA